ncbi:MAG TPA: site-2 protease family protein [Thermoanaerobaculia bacterium]|nr:site-2 protease family protein [Thermoanaerobaculia bacterium]
MFYLAVLVLLSLLVLIHEAGHLIAAKMVGIPIADFSVGLGPKIWSRRRGRTEYSFRAIPLGGFVMPAVTDEDDFRTFALRKRLAYFLGGPLANLAAAVVLFAVLNVAARGFSFGAVLIDPFRQIVEECWQVLVSLPGLFKHPGKLSGPIGIVVLGGKVAAAGKLLQLAISLNVSLAVFNLLPIPVLDGGQILMSSLEERFPRMTGLRVPLTVMGLIVLASLMIFATQQDVVHLFS